MRGKRMGPSEEKIIEAATKARKLKKFKNVPAVAQEDTYDLVVLQLKKSTPIFTGLMRSTRIDIAYDEVQDQSAIDAIKHRYNLSDTVIDAAVRAMFIFSYNELQRLYALERRGYSGPRSTSSNKRRVPPNNSLF